MNMPASTSPTPAEIELHEKIDRINEEDHHPDVGKALEQCHILAPLEHHQRTKYGKAICFFAAKARLSVDEDIDRLASYWKHLAAKVNTKFKADLSAEDVSNVWEWIRESKDETIEGLRLLWQEPINANLQYRCIGGFRMYGPKSPGKSAISTAWMECG